MFLTDFDQALKDNKVLNDVIGNIDNPVSSFNKFERNAHLDDKSKIKHDKIFYDSNIEVMKDFDNYHKVKFTKLRDGEEGLIR